MTAGSAMTRQEPARSGAGRGMTRIALIAMLALIGSLVAQPAAQAGSFQADGSYSGTPSATVAALFAANTNGGDGLVDAVRTLLLANPELADDVAYLASRAPPAQQAAAAAGMAQAFIVLTQRGDSPGAARIVSAAQRSGNAVIQTVLTNALGRSTVYADQSGNPVTGKSNCRPPVSPSAPTTCQ
jgi:hypothetical protein